jgi:hypothetical protein
VSAAAAPAGLPDLNAAHGDLDSDGPTDGDTYADAHGDCVRSGHGLPIADGNTSGIGWRAGGWIWFDLIEDDAHARPGDVDPQAISDAHVNGAADAGGRADVDCRADTDRAGSS